MKTLRPAIDRLLGSVICVLMAAMVLNVLWQVFTRFVLRQPSSFTEELARYMMIWVGLLGSAYATGKKSHLALDLVTAHLHGARKRVSELFVHGAVLLFALTVLVGGGGRLVYIQLSLGRPAAETGLRLPRRAAGRPPDRFLQRAGPRRRRPRRNPDRRTILGTELT